MEPAGEVFGDAPNVAARVQAAAEPGAVLVTASVQRQTAGLFVVEDKGAHQLKGVPAPMMLYRIVRASGAGRRGGARTMTPLVGREDELALIMRRWARALQGEGQFVQIVGEPGIGKSRLLEEFRGKLADTPHTWVEWASSQLLQNTPLHPVAEWGRQRFGAAEVAAEQRLADLEGTLRLIGLDAAEYAPLLAPLVDIPLPEDRAAKFPPEELRRRQLAALTAWVLAGARSQPVALAFEDLHWADPTSLDLMQALAERGAQAPLFILATTRPEFRAPWSLRSHHSVISLSPLDRADVAQMVGELAARHALSREVVEGVCDRTGGVPLFVEEVTRLLLEGGGQTIPPTLQQSLAARLDRLGKAREVAQIGAVLGREFSYALLRSVAGVADPGSSGHAGLSEAGLQSALDRLTEADLLFAEGAPPSGSYRFKHALIRDAAYDSLLKSRRQALHRRAADALLAADAEPEAIAHHFTQAGLDDLAIEWWGKAGDQALRRSAFQEAIAHLGKAIGMADRADATGRRVPGGSAAPSQRLTQLQVAYGNAAIAARGYGAPETTEGFARAREAASGDNDAPGRLAADYGLWVGGYVRGELTSMRAHAAAFLRDVEAMPDLGEAGVAHRVQGTTHQFAGEYIEARHHLERALALFQPGRDDDLAFRFGHDAGVAALVYLSMVLWPLGEVDRAISLIDRMQTRMAGTSHIGTHGMGETHAALFELMRGHRARAALHALELADITRERDLPMFHAFSVFLEGWAASQSGAPAQGLEDMRLGAELLREQNVLNFDGLLKIALAEAEARAGDPDRAVAILDEALATCDRTGYRAFEAELHRARGEMLLKRDPANPAPAEEAFLTAVAVAKRQATRSFELRAALSLGKLYRSTGRPADAHTVLAPALEGFAPPSPSGRRAGDEGYQPNDEGLQALTPGPSPGWERGDAAAAEMPEIAEAQALLTALVETEEVRAELARRQQQRHLQVAFGNALIAARGPSAAETTEAFAKARVHASDKSGSIERFAADFGLWLGSSIRGDLPSMRAHAEALFRDVEMRPDSAEAGVAHRVQGINDYFNGDYVEAQRHLERALALFEPGRDDDVTYRLGVDAGVAAMALLAFAAWPLGEVDRAISLIDRMTARAATLANANTRAFGAAFVCLFELLRGGISRAAPNAVELGRIAREHDLPMWRAFALFFERPTTGESGALEDMRRGVELLREQNVLLFDGLLKIALAEAEARAGDPDRAIAILDEALATCDRLGHRAFDAELHRVRGETLLKRDPANPAPAEDAFLTAIAVAKQQTTRSFGLQAALRLAKLCQSTCRPADAHAVLAPALEGFSPTPEMPEIAEAQALLEALSHTDEVKAQAAQRQRLTQLHVAYGNALFAARGTGAPETTEAFARARELASGDKDAPERLAADWGLWAGSYVRGDLSSMRAHAAAFLNDVEASPDLPEAGVAHRCAGITCWFAGEYREARDRLERALALFQPGRNDDLAFRFAWDPGVAAMANLATVSWPLGEVDRAVSLNDRMQTRIADLTHVGTLAPGRIHAALFELMRGDRARAAPNALELARLAREHDLPMYRAFGVFLEGLGIATSGAISSGLDDMRRGVELLREQNVLWFEGLLKVALAETEARAGDPDRAVAILDEALATCDRTGYRAFEAELHRARGDILLKRDPANPAPAEEALRTAIAVAKRQGTRSFELRAALSLAKLYQSTGRPVDAHAVLAPALEGFSPTPEMPEIAEAQALLAG